MPSNRKLPKKHSNNAVIVVAIASSAISILVAVLSPFLLFYPSLPHNKNIIPTLTSTPNIFYENHYPTDGINQPNVIDTIKDNMDMLENMFSWAILIALTIGWAGLIKQGDIEIIGIKVKRKYAFYLVATLYLVVNIALIILFARLGELLLLLDNANFIEGLSKVTIHTWLLNPYSFFGYSILSRGFSSLGYGLLIFCWWICYTSLYLLRDGKETSTTKTLPILFLVVGLLALIIINRNYDIISLRLADINSEFYNAINATRTERTVVGLVGIGLGVSLFTFLVNMQSKLTAKLSPQKDSLVYCPKCNIPFKSENDLGTHVTNWHTEKDKKN